MTCISWFSGFALYLQGHGIYEHDALDYKSEWDQAFGPKINVGRCDQFNMNINIAWFSIDAVYHQDHWLYGQDALGL